MCGRIIRRTSRGLISQDLGLGDDESPDGRPRYNIPPGSRILVVRTEAGGRELVNLRWGLIPSWAKDEKIAWKMINARAETLSEKPAFRDAFRNRRCLIPIDGFYEWKKTEDGKIPYFIRALDERVFYVAGLWERWRNPSGGLVESCAIVTTGANEALASIHDRMPVIVHRNHIDRWLDPNTRDVLDLLQSGTSEELQATAVSTHVNDQRNDDEACLRAVAI